MEREQLINKVKTRIDEVSASGDVIVDVGVENTKPFDSIIDELLDESVTEVLLKAPFYRLETIEEKGLVGTPVANDENIGTVELPDDCLRLVSFKMRDWLCPVTSFAVPGDAVATRQSNKYIRGGVAKPVAVLRKLGTLFNISYYSVKESHEVEELIYVAKHTEGASRIEIEDQQMIDALCWICAGKTLGVLGEKGLAEMCYENAKGLLI